MATTFVLLNDVHLYRGPASRTDDYESAIFGKLEQVSKLATKIRADAVSVAGDFFHLKQRVPYSTTIRLMEWAYALRAAGTQVLGIAGNHDLQHDRIESLSAQPLGLLFRSGAITDVAYAAIEFDDAVVSGVPYPDAKNISNFARVPRSAKRHGLLLAHCFALPEGGDYFGETVHPYAALFPHAPYDVVHLGHDHRDHGVTRMGERYVVNIGAIARGSLSTDEITRDVKVAIVECDEVGATVRQVRLNVAPAEQIFDLALHAQKRETRDQIETFVADLATRLDAAGPVDLNARVNALDLSGTVRRRVAEYLQAAELTPGS